MNYLQLWFIFPMISFNFCTHSRVSTSSFIACSKSSWPPDITSFIISCILGDLNIATNSSLPIIALSISGGIPPGNVPSPPTVFSIISSDTSKLSPLALASRFLLLNSSIMDGSALPDDRASMRRNSNDSLSKQSVWEIFRRSSSDLISLIFICPGSAGSSSTSSSAPTTIQRGDTMAMPVRCLFCNAKADVPVMATLAKKNAAMSKLK
mmetsp:Transcript_27254/g.56804  ORF Transcript_27254/g.56804 Transcript_27254/m.56804 type:complete len:209 (-) Transcript_27254:83-709(-)